MGKAERIKALEKAVAYQAGRIVSNDRLLAALTVKFEKLESEMADRWAGCPHCAARKAKQLAAVERYRAKKIGAKNIA